MTNNTVKAWNSSVKITMIIMLVSLWIPLIGYSQGNDIDVLIQKLKDKEQGVARRSAEALAKIGTPAAESLIIALKDEDFPVRIGAAWVLGKIKDARAVEPLIAALKDEKPTVRLMAAEALGEIKDARTVEPLIAALKDKDRRVFLSLFESFDYSRQVVVATNKNGKKEARVSDRSLIKSNVPRSAARALGKIKDIRAIEPLIASLKHDPFLPEIIADALGNIGMSAVEPLIIALKDADPQIKRVAAKSLGKIKDVRAVELLIAALKDKDQGVRENAAEALGEIKDNRAIKVLIGALNEKKLDIVAGAYRFFIYRGESGTESILIEALNEYGDSTMAIDLLNCGNSLLSKAANDWAKKHDFEIIDIPNDIGGSRWGVSFK